MNDKERIIYAAVLHRLKQGQGSYVISYGLVSDHGQIEVSPPRMLKHGEKILMQITAGGQVFEAKKWDVPYRTKSTILSAIEEWRREVNNNE